MAKLGKRSVRYRKAAKRSKKRCGTCVMFRPVLPSAGYCTLVEGMITAGAVCDRWEKR